MGWQMPYSDLDLYVEVAWGAAVTSDPAGWSWSDITADVRVSDRVVIACGRADEQSTASPTSLSLTLSNPDGRYLTGPGPNFPNVRRNTPVRVRVVTRATGATLRTLFYGYATTWTPRFAPRTPPTVVLAAHGATRRLGQGAGIADSAMTRYLRSQPTILEWWPLEDAEASVIGLSGVPGGTGMTYIPGSTTKSKVAPSDAAPSGASRSVTLTQGAALSGAVRHQSLGSSWAVGFSILIDHGSDVDRFVRIDMSGGRGAYVQVRVFTLNGGDPGVQVSAFSSAVPGGEQWLGYQGIGFRDWSTGGARWYHFVLTTDGSGALLRVLPDPLDAARTTYTMTFPMTLASILPTAPTRIEVGSIDGSDLQVGVSHVHVGSLYSYYGLAAGGSNPTPQGAWFRETTTARVARLAAEERLTLSTVAPGASMVMGVQPPAPVLDLLRECERAEQGLLVDGIDGVDLRWVAKSKFETPSTAATIAAADLGEPFGPIDDDQRLRNAVSAKRAGGTEQTHRILDGPLGIATVGEYATSLDVNVPADGDALAYAQWVAYLGTRPGYRWPSVTTPHPATAGVITGWTPGETIAVTGPSTVLPGVSTGDLRLLTEGVSTVITEAVWWTTATCSPADAWLTATLSGAGDGSSPNVARVTSDGSVLATAAAAGATVLSVSTPTGPRWTTDPDDWAYTSGDGGLVLDVGGHRVRVTDISGTGTTQTVTVAAPGLPAGLPAGVSVDLWNQPVLGL